MILLRGKVCCLSEVYMVSYLHSSLYKLYILWRRSSQQTLLVLISACYIGVLVNSHSTLSTLTRVGKGII